MSHGEDRPLDYMDLLDPQALLRVHRLELLARSVVEGSLAGRHKSPCKGFSAEFVEHREYSPGDDPRALDWKVFARSDRYCIRQYAEETNLRCLILVDASGSMAYTGQRSAEHRGSRVSKFRYAQLLAAALAHLMIRQQDAVGLALFDSALRQYIPARGKESHLREILRTLAAAQPEGVSGMPEVLHELAERFQRRGLAIVISDFLTPSEPLLSALHHFRFRRHEVLLLHVLAEEEITFPFGRTTRFRDLESPHRYVDADASAVRAEYLRQLSAHVERLRLGAGEMHIDYVPLSTAQPFDLALAKYLANRRSRRR